MGTYANRKRRSRVINGAIEALQDFRKGMDKVIWQHPGLRREWRNLKGIVTLTLTAVYSMKTCMSFLPPQELEKLKDSATSRYYDCIWTVADKLAAMLILEPHEGFSFWPFDGRYMPRQFRPALRRFRRQGVRTHRAEFPEVGDVMVSAYGIGSPWHSACCFSLDGQHRHVILLHLHPVHIEKSWLSMTTANLRMIARHELLHALCEERYGFHRDGDHDPNFVREALRRGIYLNEKETDHD